MFNLFLFYRLIDFLIQYDGEQAYKIILPTITKYYSNISPKEKFYILINIKKRLRKSFKKKEKVYISIRN